MPTFNDATLSRVVVYTLEFLLGAILLLASGCSSLAQPSPSAQENRFYVGLGILGSRLAPDARDNDNFMVVDKTSSGGSLLLGFDINHRFSIDAGLSHLGEAGFSPAGSIDYNVGHISALAYAFSKRGDQARNGFSAFGRLGIGAMDNNSEADLVPFKRLNDVHLVAGLGIEYGFRNGLALRTEFISQDTDAQYGQLGLLYRFGTHNRDTNIEQLAGKTVTDPTTDNQVAPEPSSLADSVNSETNAVDKCPDDKLSQSEKSYGCSEFSLPVMDISFRSGSDNLTARAKDNLNELAGILKIHRDIRLYVEAHTDNTGDASSNLTLSKRRALAVTRYLVEAGVYPTRLTPRAYGESRPIAKNNTAQGRAKNRRIEFNVISQDQ